jgi:hypothetical protein
MDRTWVLIESFFASPITWGVVTLLAIALALSGKLNMNAATAVLWLAFFTALFGVYRAEAILKTDILMRYLILGCCAFGFASGTVALNRWMISPKEETHSQPAAVQPHEAPEKGADAPDKPTLMPQAPSKVAVKRAKSAPLAAHSDKSEGKPQNDRTEEHVPTADEIADALAKRYPAPGPAQKYSQAPLKQRALKLSDDLIDFLRARRKVEPPYEPEREWRAFQEETIEIYKKRFAGEVINVFQDIEKAGVWTGNYDQEAAMAVNPLLIGELATKMRAYALKLPD